MRASRYDPASVDLPFVRLAQLLLNLRRFNCLGVRRHGALAHTRPHPVLRNILTSTNSLDNQRSNEYAIYLTGGLTRPGAPQVKDNRQWKLYATSQMELYAFKLNFAERAEMLTDRRAPRRRSPAA